MKKLPVYILSFISLFSFSGKGQGTLFVSNLSQPVNTIVFIAHDSWYANSFTTGPNSLGYSLNSVQLLMQTAIGNPSGFSVSIYLGNGGFPSSTNVGNLSGSDPLAGGVHSYSASMVTLLPSTRYFVVVSAQTFLSTGAFRWSSPTTGFSDTTGGWSYGPYHSTSTDGINWSRSAPDLQYAVYATAIPEPSSAVVLALGSLMLATSLRRRHKYRFNHSPTNNAIEFFRIEGL